MINKDKILVINGKVVLPNSKIDWPDMNYPGTGATILRVVHEIDYKNNTFRMDGEKGPVYSENNFPECVNFYKKA
jgi:hypothetical protein